MFTEKFADCRFDPVRNRTHAFLYSRGPVLAISLTFLAMFLWTWGRWVDPFTDIGRELYVAWQLAEGSVLYRDIAYFNGPLSPYFNSLWFRAFGPGFWVLASVNCGVILCILLLLFYVCQNAAGRFAATLAGLAFLGYFAFAVLIPLGNFSYVAPYSHEMTHGILLCFCLVAALFRYLRTQRLAFFFVMALCAGLLQLTKIEMCLAGLCASLAGLALALASPLSDGKTRRQLVALYAAGLLIPAAAAFGLLALAMPVRQAFWGALAPYLAFTYEGIASMPFYASIMGMDDPAQRLATMIAWTAAYVGIFAWLAGWAILIKKRPGPLSRAGVFMVLVPALAAGFLKDQIQWANMATPYGLLLLACLAWVFRSWLENRDDPEKAGLRAFRIVLIVLALSLLPKMLLNQKIFLYGFGLGLPATLVMILALTAWLPREVKKAGGSSAAFQCGVLCFMCILGTVYMQAAKTYMEPRVHAMGQGRDFMFWDSKAVTFNLTLKAMRENIPQNATMAVLPSCVMFNYLGRVRHSNPYIMCITPEMAMYGEDKILSAYKKAPPDFILLAHQDNSQYGAQYFGKDYGQDFYKWIMEGYEGIVSLGPPPFQADAGGVVILKRKTGAGQGGQTAD